MGYFLEPLELSLSKGENIPAALSSKPGSSNHGLARNLTQPTRHAFGYNSRRGHARPRARPLPYAGSHSASMQRSTDESREQRPTIHRCGKFLSTGRMGVDETDCIDYLREQLGITWRKSACVQCPFNALKDDALERQKEHPEQ